MTLNDLVGEHMLSGVDFVTVKVKGFWDREEECNACRFVVDGKTISAIEDPDDGYRSHLRDLVVSDEPITNTWDPVRVVGSMCERGKYGDEAEVLELRDVTTGAVVLRVGTENTNDYYPYYVAELDPKALAHNAGTP